MAKAELRVEDRLWTIAQVAERLRVSKPTIRRAIRLDRLRVVYVGRGVRIRESAIAAWLMTTNDPGTPRV